MSLLDTCRTILDIHLRLERYYLRAMVVGISKDRAKALLDDELKRAAMSPSRSALDALESATRKLTEIP